MTSSGGAVFYSAAVVRYVGYYWIARFSGR